MKLTKRGYELLERGGFVSTDEASEATLLSTWALRRGYENGTLPALKIGSGGRCKRLRWDLEMLCSALEKETAKGKIA